MTQDDLNQNDLVPTIATEDSFGEAPLESDNSQLVPVLPSPRAPSWKRRFCAATLAILLIGLIATMLIKGRSTDSQTRRPPAPMSSQSTASPSMPTEGMSNAHSHQTVVPNQLEDAKSYWEAGEFQKVVDVCDEILAIEPVHERAIYLRALAHAELGNSILAVKDHFSLQKHNSELSKKGSEKLVKAYNYVILLGLREAKELMEQSQTRKSTLRLDQCIQLCDSGLQFQPSASEIKSLRAESLQWKETCELATADRTGLISSSLKLRQWSDKTESHSITARLVNVDQKVRLERADGTKTAIEIEQLSADDQRWLGQLMKRKSEVRIIAK